MKEDSYLHTDDRVDEKQHRDEETNVRQSLKERRYCHVFYLQSFESLIAIIKIQTEWNQKFLTTSKHDSSLSYSRKWKKW